MPAIQNRAGLCPTCGTTIDTGSAEADLGCMVCLLRVGLDDSAHEETADSLPEVVPDQFGAYTIARHDDGSPWELGRGAMGVTYRAIDVSLARPVALKIIHSNQSRSRSQATARFTREARAAASLRHPNIATVYHFGIREETGQCFYAMELIEGETLEERMQRTGPLDSRAAAEIARQVTEALLAAQKQGLVHRDIKPSNLMMVEGDNGVDFTIKVIDFGIAKAVAETTDVRTLTHAGFVGTPAFASPEQFTNKPIDVRSDIYSLGATLWFVLTGHTPFGDSTSRARTANPPLAQLRAAKVPAHFRAVLHSMLANEPAARPGLQELGAKLARFRRSRRGIRTGYFAFAAAALTVLSAALYLFLPPKAPVENWSADKSIAVLPFENLSDDPTNAYLASGIHEDVLVNLSKIGGLRVISRNSVLAYKTGPRDLKEIGKALGVSDLLEGSVRREGNRARINIQLIHVANGQQIWAENFDRELANTFSIQSELALHIAAALEANLSPKENAGLQRSPTKDGEAYLLYLQANNLVAPYQKPRAALDEAERLYQEAIARDPSFALAFARLSQLETLYRNEYETSFARSQKAQAAAEEALRLQPDLPEAHLALGRFHWEGKVSAGEIDLDAALREFTIAQRSLPNSAEVFGLIGRSQLDKGNFTEAIANLKKAASLDPNSVERWHRLFFAYHITRDFASAAGALDHAIAVAPNPWMFQLHRAWQQLFWKKDLTALQNLPAPTGDDPEGHRAADFAASRIYIRQFAEAEKILLADPHDPIETNKGMLPKKLLLGAYSFMAGDKEKSRALYEQVRPGLERAVEEHSLDVNGHLRLAEAYAGLGRKEDAIREARRALEIFPESKNLLGSLSDSLYAAWIYAMTDEPDLAIPLLAHILAAPAGENVNSLRIHPRWDPLRNDPRFENLLRQYEAKQTAAR
ncbi:MAG TPA: protein kinase [Chthoniobacterales bacterium]|nr:protein kinase [Chthoniobacterales bacterium]